MKTLDELFEKLDTLPRADDLQITADRPSIVNGLMDITEYGDVILEKQEEFQKRVMETFGESSKEISQVVLSELYYQRNDCYNALIQAVGALPLLERNGYYTVLFAGLYIQMCVLIATGQLGAIYPTIDSMGKWIYKSQSNQLITNFEALRAWCALYDDDWDVVDAWMGKMAPSALKEITLSDTFCFMVKARIYLLYEKYGALIALAGLLRPTLEENNRLMEMCELDMLVVMANYASNHKDIAYDLMDKVLDVVKQYHFDRLLADEGELMYRLLKSYMSVRKCTDPYVKNIMLMAKRFALLYPRYLRHHKLDYQALTAAELEVLKLMADHRTNAEIADFLDVTINTVKFHSKNIFKKLGAKNRQQAVSIGREEKYI